MLCDALTDVRADTSVAETIDSATGIVMIVADDAVESFIVISAGIDGEVDAEAVCSHTDKIQWARCFGPCLEVRDEAVLTAARIAHDMGMSMVFNLSPIWVISEDLLALVNTLIINKHELAVVIGPERVVVGRSHNRWGAVRCALSDEHGVSTATIALGGEGSTVSRMSESEVTVMHISALAIEVVDTTGYGDVYMDTVLTAMAADDDVVTVARFAAVVSVYAVIDVGAQTSYDETGKTAQSAMDHKL